MAHGRQSSLSLLVVTTTRVETVRGGGCEDAKRAAERMRVVVLRAERTADVGVS